MKNLAELKRAIKPGVRFLCTEHWMDDRQEREIEATLARTEEISIDGRVVAARQIAPLPRAPKNVGTVRTVVKAQGTSYAFTIPGRDGLLWSPHGKAACYTFPTPDTYRFADGHAFWTLKLLPEEATNA